jgi:sporulation protein YlmC with PRC-barrel domain
MEDKNRNLYYLNDLSDYKVADGYPDVRGWEVVDAEGRRVGNVDGLLVNKNRERVIYLDVEVNKDVIEEGHRPFATPDKKGVHEFINKDGEDHVIVPIGVASIDEDNNRVCTNEINRETFAKTKRFNRGSDIDRSAELIVFTTYFPNEDVSRDNNSGDRFYDRREFRRE